MKNIFLLDDAVSDTEFAAFQAYTAWVEQDWVCVLLIRLSPRKKKGKNHFKFKVGLFTRIRKLWNCCEETITSSFLLWMSINTNKMYRYVTEQSAIKFKLNWFSTLRHERISCKVTCTEIMQRLVFSFEDKLTWVFLLSGVKSEEIWGPQCPHQPHLNSNQELRRTHYYTKFHLVFIYV